MNERVIAYANAAQDIGKDLVHKGVKLYEDRDVVKDKVKGIVKTEFDKVSGLDIFDFTVFKLAILSLGISIGAHFSKKLKKLAPLFCIFTAIASAYVVIKLFFSNDD